MLWMTWFAVAGASDVLTEQAHGELLVGFHAGERSYGAFVVVAPQLSLSRSF